MRVVLPILLMATALSRTACITAPEVEQTLTKWTGRNISDLIEERSVYPEAIDKLPSGNVVYRFANVAWTRINRSGYVSQIVCRVWIETDVTGKILRWRYENCA